MEISDPDDFITLLGHPLVHLKTVTVLPPHQIGFLRYVHEGVGTLY